MTRTDRNQWIWLVALSVVLTAICVWIGTRPAPQGDPLPELVTGADGVGHAMGRVADLEAAESFRARQPVQWFGDTPAGKVRLAAGDTTVLLSDAAKVHFGGRHLPTRDQGQVGSCVSFGTAAAIEYLMLVQMSRGELLDFHELVQEAIYGLSRVEIGGGRIRGDGSVGAWAAEAVKKFGVITRAKHGNYDLLRYSESLCRQWGKSGLPDDLEPLARESPVRGITGIRNADEAKKAIIQGYPIAVCSDQGFSSTRDKDGFARASGSWAHCMAVIGYTDTPRPAFLILNSWGPSWISGPKGKFDIPDGSFWCEYAVFDRMCKAADTWAFSDAVGFPAKDPFFIGIQPVDPLLVTVPRRRGADTNRPAKLALPAMAY